MNVYAHTQMRKARLKEVKQLAQGEKVKVPNRTQAVKFQGLLALGFCSNSNDAEI